METNTPNLSPERALAQLRQVARNSGTLENVGQAVPDKMKTWLLCCRNIFQSIRLYHFKLSLIV